MPIATIEYNLDNLDDEIAFLRATRSTDMTLALWEISYNLRKTLERHFEKSNDDHTDVVFAHINDILEKYNLTDIDKLIK